MMALLLALATNIGVGGMVEGFRQTFAGWLDERLAAEIYYEAATPADARDIEIMGAEAAGHHGGPPDLARPDAAWRLAGRPDRHGAARDLFQHFTLLEGGADAFRALHDEDAVLISEQLARRLKTRLGATLDIPASGANWPVRIVGIYPDYGNAKGQLRVDHERLARHFTDVSGVNYSLRVAPGAVARVMEEMRTRFGPAIVRMIDQGELKKLSTERF